MFSVFKLIKAKKIVVKNSRSCLHEIIRNSEKLNMKMIFVVLAALCLGYSVYNAQKIKELESELLSATAGRIFWKQTVVTCDNLLKYVPNHHFV